MKKPNFPSCLEQQIIFNEEYLLTCGERANASKVISYLNALRYGTVSFIQEEVIEVSTANLLYSENLMRIKDENGTNLLTDSVIESLKEWDILPEVAQYLVDLALYHACNHSCCVGINIPPQLFEDDDMRNKLTRSLRRAENNGVSPSQIFLEIIEYPGLKLDGMKKMHRWMKFITKKGYRIGLDDFGDPKGSHTIEHLKVIPNSFLKLDGYITNQMLDGTFDEDSYAEVFAHCKANDIHIIAEHVPNVDTARMLVNMHPVTHVQSMHIKCDNFHV